MSRIAHFLDSRLTDGGEVSALQAGRALPPQKSGNHISERLNKPQGLVHLEELNKLKRK
jgi:hypothetical protein